jgi:hypothetical protein
MREPPPFDPRSIPLDGPDDRPSSASHFDARAIPLEGPYTRTALESAPASAAPTVEEGCPKCGFPKAAGVPTCGRCGLIFARYDAQQQRMRSSTSSTSSRGGAAAAPAATGEELRPRVVGPLGVGGAVQAALAGWSSALSEWPSVLFFNLVPSLLAVGLAFFGGLIAAFVVFAQSGGIGTVLGAALAACGAILLVVRVAGACAAGTVVVLDDHAGGAVASRGFSEAFSVGWSVGMRVAFSMTMVVLAYVAAVAPVVIAVAQHARSGTIFLFAVVGVVAGVLLTVRLAFVLPAIVLEGEGAIGGLQRSFELTSGRFLPVLAALVVLMLASMAIGVVAAVLSTLLLGVPFAGVVVSAVANAIATSLLQGGIVHLWRALRAE